MGERDLLWWIGATVMFLLIFDIALVAMKKRTISRSLTMRFGLDLPRAMFYFVMGGLFVHFTNWRTQGEDDKPDIFEGKK